MIAYKGLHKDSDGTLFCKDKIYEPGKTYKFDGEIELCKRGFHACHELWQAWPFYPNNGENVFYEVECGGEIIESNKGDGKFVCSEITLIKEVDMSNLTRFDDACVFSEGFAVVELNGKGCNFIGTDGKFLSEQWFDGTYDFNEGFAKVNLNGKWNIINTDGKIQSEQWFDYIWNFSEGFAMVELNGKGYNYIGTNGKLLSNKWFDYAS